MNNFSSRIEKIFRDIFFILFLLLISGYILLPKAFPKLNIRIGPISLYITEIYIFLSIIFIIALIIKNKFRIEKIYFFNYFLFFFTIFILALSIGLYSYRDIIYILRQSALFYYSLFYFIVFYLFNEVKKIKYFIITILVCSNLLIFVFLVRYLGFGSKIFGSSVNYMTGGYYFPIAILLILEINLIEIIKKKFLIILISLDILVLIILSVLENVRGNWIAIAIAIIFSFILARNKKKFLIYASILLLMLVILFIIAGFIKPQLFENTLNEIKSLKSFFLNDAGDNQNVAVINTNWRVITWKGFLKEFLKKPVFGWGFGRKFLPGETFDLGWNTGLADNWVATHNYIISFLYISGIVGLLIFGLIIVNFFRKNIRFLKTSFLSRNWYLVKSFLCCMVYILILGLFEVVMEVPYQGVFFWVFFGFNILIIKNFFNDKNKNITNEKDVGKN